MWQLVDKAEDMLTCSCTFIVIMFIVAWSRCTSYYILTLFPIFYDTEKDMLRFPIFPLSIDVTIHRSYAVEILPGNEFTM